MVMFKNKIPKSHLISLGRKMISDISNGSIESLKVYDSLLIGNLRTTVPKGIDVNRVLKGKIEKVRDGSEYNLEFRGDETTWKTLRDWNSGTPPVTHAAIKVTPEQATKEAERIKREYTRKGWNWKKSRVYRKAVLEHKIIRKLPKPVEGRVGTHAIEQTANRLVKKSLIPELNKVISKVLGDIAQ